MPRGGIRAVTVEVGFDNAPAQALHRRIGLQPAEDRQLLALALGRARPPSLTRRGDTDGNSRPPVAAPRAGR